jgi:hypothetical protein
LLLGRTYCQWLVNGLEFHPMSETQTETARALQTALDRRDNGGAPGK